MGPWGTLGAASRNTPSENQISLVRKHCEVIHGQTSTLGPYTPCWRKGEGNYLRTTYKRRTIETLNALAAQFGVPPNSGGREGSANYLVARVSCGDR